MATIPETTLAPVCNVQGLEVKDTRDAKRLKAAQQQTLPAFYIAMTAIGGLLAVPAIPRYAVWSFIPVCTAVFAYFLVVKTWRKRFALLGASNFLIGWVLYFLPHASNGGLCAVGLMVAVPLLVFDMWLLRSLWKAQAEFRVVDEHASGAKSEEARAG